MKHRGGYNVPLVGRPSADIVDIPPDGDLRLPLQSARFTFSEVCVDEGEIVAAGRVLARDPANYGVPLLAPRAGTVELASLAEHIVLTGASSPTADGSPHMACSPVGDGADGEARGVLLGLGAWPFLFDTATGGVPDPGRAPKAVMVSLLHLEPFAARGDALIRNDLDTFVSGLEALRTATAGAPVQVVLPDIRSELTDRVHDALRELEGVTTATIPLRYPLDHFRLLRGQLQLRDADNGNVWGMRAEGVVAANCALHERKPCTTRVVAIGGPGAAGPTHVKVAVGQPLDALLKRFLAESGAVRIIRGGALTGSAVEDPGQGIDVECTGLTLLPEPGERTFFEFARLGFSEHSFARCFLSVLRPRFMERFTDDMKGEHRPCIACNFCDDLCPAGILPFQLYRYLRHDALEEAEAAGLDACVGCGLCSYVCPSKIEISKMLVEGQGRVERELRAHRDGQEKA